VVQEQTISVGLGSRGALPIQFVIQNFDFEKIKKVIPEFLEQARKNGTFQAVDVNLKFNKPELEISVDRLKAKDAGVACRHRRSPSSSLQWQENGVFYYERQTVPSNRASQ